MRTCSLTPTTLPRAPAAYEPHETQRPRTNLTNVGGRVGDAGQGGVGGGVRAAVGRVSRPEARTAPGSGSSGDHVYSYPAWPGQRQGLAGLPAGYPVTSSAR